MKKKFAVALVATAAAATAAIFIFSSGATGSHTVVGDHYNCYLAVDNPPVLDPPPVDLQDQFGPEPQTNPRPADRLCLPASKNNAPLRDPQTHLKRYPIPGTFGPVTVRVDNQFGIFTIKLTGPKFLMVPTSKNTGQQPNPAAPEFEHYKCYTSRPVVGVRDQFNATTNRSINVLHWLLCAPVRKVHGPNTFNIKRPARHLLCFATPVAQPQRNVQALNQFGQEQLTLSNQREFCVPSTKQVIAPPPT
jgi:hypothetical protein